MNSVWNKYKRRTTKNDNHIRKYKSGECKKEEFKQLDVSKCTLRDI